MADPTLEEIARRRTFAIISHPDAGKTTLTEKVLLYGGAIQVAGEVKARKNKKSATSDWMAMEKERGISVATSVMQIDFEGHRWYWTHRGTTISAKTPTEHSLRRIVR